MTLEMRKAATEPGVNALPAEQQIERLPDEIVTIRNGQFAQPIQTGREASPPSNMTQTVVPTGGVAFD
jgi:hypothetical protein